MAADKCFLDLLAISFSNYLIRVEIAFRLFGVVFAGQWLTIGSQHSERCPAGLVRKSSGQLGSGKLLSVPQQREKGMNSSADKVTEALEDLCIPYEIIRIDPMFADTAQFCETYGYSLEHTCNTILVASRKEPKKFAACVVLANTRLDVNKRVRNLLGVSKVSFATPEQTLEITGMQLGGVTPLALPSQLPLYVDQRVLALQWVILGGGSREIKVKVAPSIFGALRAEIIPELALRTDALGAGKES